MKAYQVECAQQTVFNTAQVEDRSRTQQAQTTTKAVACRTRSDVSTSKCSTIQSISHAGNEAASAWALAGIAHHCQPLGACWVIYTVWTNVFVLVRANTLEKYRYVRVFVRDEHMKYVICILFKFQVASGSVKSSVLPHFAVFCSRLSNFAVLYSVIFVCFVAYYIRSIRRKLEFKCFHTYFLVSIWLL